MAIHAGKDGFVKLDGGALAYLDNYSLTINAGSADVTSLGDEWKKSLATQKDWSGSASGTLDLADPEQRTVLAMFTGAAQVVAQQLMFGLGGNSSYGGSATITSIQLGCNVSDKITFSFNFTGNGALTLINEYDTTRVATPGFSVSGEGTASASVTITCATASADVYYTTDGTTPTAQSSQYSAAISLTTPGVYTVKAIGKKASLTDSVIASVVVTVVGA